MRILTKVGNFWYWHGDKVLLLVLILVAVGMLSWGIHTALERDNVCYSAGYPKRVGDFCFKRVDGTDIIIPLEELR